MCMKKNNGPLHLKSNPLWLTHPEVTEIIKSTWKKKKEGSPSYIWESKFKVVKFALNVWSKNRYIDPFKEKKQIHGKLLYTQNQMEEGIITLQL